MCKNVLILSSSPRTGGNSETLAAAFAKGAEEAGNQVETVYLREMQYGFCKGCLACQKLGHCVIKDDAVEIATKMHDADVLCLQRRSTITASAVSSRPCWIVPIRSLIPITPLPRHIFWQLRLRMGKKRWKAPSRRYKAGWTALNGVSWQAPSLPVVSTA